MEGQCPRGLRYALGSAAGWMAGPEIPKSMVSRSLVFFLKSLPVGS